MKPRASEPTSWFTVADFRLMAEWIPHIVWTAKADGRMDYLNQRGMDYAGLPPEGAYAWDWASLVHADDLEGVKEAWVHATRTATPFRLDYRIRRADQEYRWHAFRASPLKDAAGVACKWVGTAIDIEDGRRAVDEVQLANREMDETLRVLQASENRLDVAQRIAHIGSFEFDSAANELHWSDEQCRILGLPLGLRPTMTLFLSLIHTDDQADVRADWVAATMGSSFDRAVRIIRPDSEERYVRLRAVPERSAEGTVSRIIGTVVDDTDRVEAERVRRAAETRFEIGFEQAAIGTAIADLDGIPTRVNPALCALLGRSTDELVGKLWAEFTHSNDLPLRQAVLARAAEGHDTYEDERRFVRPDGTIVWVCAHVTLVRDEDRKPQYFFMQIDDITDRKQLEQDLAHQALHDSLTGLPNRALLNDRLTHSLAGVRRRGTNLSVIFVDLDHFKVVNDSLGHGLGDELLRHCGDRIAITVRPGDTVARFGGDEFVIVCDDVDLSETEQLADRVLEVLNQPCVVGDHEMNVTVSIGIAIADRDATPESLLRDSDFAMYRAKELGRGRREVFDEALRSKGEARLATASALHRALERHEFTVHYQPIVDLTNGGMVGAEALVRWEHPDGILVNPVEFIPVAEETGLIVPIGEWVLEEACRQLVEWQRTDPWMSLAVNLSVRQMTNPSVTSAIHDILARVGVNPERVCLELTESVFMEDVDYFATALAQLKETGVQLAIDDFGTGYSSLGYLKRFPIDALKVDRSFVDGLGSDPHDSALVTAIVALAKALDLGIVAEGVETHEQLLRLKELECTQAQGFHLAQPMPAREMSQLVADHHTWMVD